MNWKDKFVLFVFIGVVAVVFVSVMMALDNSQPSIEDVMTNNGISIEEIMDQ